MRDLWLRPAGYFTIQIFYNHFADTQTDTNTIGIHLLCFCEMLKWLKNSLQILMWNAHSSV